MAIKKLIMLTAIITGFSFIVDSGNCSSNIEDNSSIEKTSNNNKFKKNRKIKQRDEKTDYFNYYELANEFGNGMNYIPDSPEYMSYEDDNYEFDNYDDNNAYNENMKVIENNKLFNDDLQTIPEEDEENNSSKNNSTENNNMTSENTNSEIDSNKSLFERYDDIINNEELYSYDMANY